MIGVVFCTIKTIPNIPIQSFEHKISPSKENIACTI